MEQSGSMLLGALLAITLGGVIYLIWWIRHHGAVIKATVDKVAEVESNLYAHAKDIHERISTEVNDLTEHVNDTVNNAKADIKDEISNQIDTISTSIEDTHTKIGEIVDSIKK